MSGCHSASQQYLSMNETPIPSPLEETVVIVGVGMIGGSLAAAIRRHRIAGHVIGVGRDRARMEAARDAGLIDEAATEIRSVLSRANLVIFCTPVERVIAEAGELERAIAEISPSPNDQIPSRDLLLTDVGSVKSPICSAWNNLPAFIGSHPIAGSHRQGFEAADAGLFSGRICVVTPVPTSIPYRLERLVRFWQAIGMRTVQMSPEAHDAALAMTSHLPHLAAAALAATLAAENRVLTGSGFRDTTRVAAGDPDLWTGILINNAEQVMAGIDHLQAGLSAFRTTLATRDLDGLKKLLVDGARSRAALDETSHR